MNAAILVLSSALASGAEVTQAGAWGDPPLPLMVIPAQGCCGPKEEKGCCGPKEDNCGCSKANCLDKLKARFASLGSKGSCCEKPAHEKPAHCAPAPSCNTCEHAPKVSLLDKFKAWHCREKKSSCCGPTESHCETPCALPGTPIIPPATNTPVPPKEMPKTPKEMPKVPAPKTSGSTAPDTLTVPQNPAPPATLAIPPAPANQQIAPNPMAIPAIPTVPAAPISSPSPLNGTSPY